MKPLLYSLIYLNFCRLSSAGLNYSSIRFTFVGRDSKNYDLTNTTQPTNLFLENSEIIVLVLAWAEQTNTSWIKEITNAYHNKTDKKYQIIYIDWSYESFSWYYNTIRNVDAIGYYAGEWLIRLSKLDGIDINRFHLISHSLGCHLAGFMGKYILKQLGRRISRITALDAAAPGFFDNTSDRRLYKGDAEIVVAIHTDCNQFGLADPYADVDLYPNGGFHGQPGCEQSMFEICSHCRSHDYWIEGITKNKFYGVQCDSWHSYQKGICAKNKKLNFAGDMGTIKKNDSGKYFTSTKGEAPFLNDLNLTTNYEQKITVNIL